MHLLSQSHGAFTMSGKSQSDQIGATLLRLASSKMTPKELLRQTRKLHPDASKKEIVRAAFASIIAVSGSDIDKALLLQDFAIKERGDDGAA
jgi:hypothetical protein